MLHCKVAVDAALELPLVAVEVDTRPELNSCTG